MQLREQTGLVCIVGANGTGKSHLLELIAACTHRLGLTPGVEIPRGDPFSDHHDFALQFHIARGVSSNIDPGLNEQQGYNEWDRTLNIESQNVPGNHQTHVTAGGIEDTETSTRLAEQVIEKLRNSKEVHFLSLDADRAYPKRSLNVNEVAQAYEINWEGPEYTRGRSFRPTKTLYDEWIKYFLAQENQAGTQLMQDIRRARENSEAEPTFQDHFLEYGSSLQQVLPHLHFTGVDSKKRTLSFDSTGLKLSFDQLSGGEREIAFLVGQIDRFGLRKGLFLLDEPELHLNADLIRKWVGYLTKTVETGQIWLATHSLEAVEAAGQYATFVLERSEETRKVDCVSRLDSRPVLSALSRAVGSPAFAISQLRFVFIEGEENLGERERFSQIAGRAQDIRFLESGSCKEVLRRVSSVRGLAEETNTEIRIGGVIDRDFQSDADVKSLMEAKGVYVLPVHEVENFFLSLDVISTLLRQNGQKGSAQEIIRQVADNRAGSWIFQRTMATSNASDLPELPSAVKKKAKGLRWQDFEKDTNDAIDTIVSASRMDQNQQKKFRRLLRNSVKSYQRNREHEDLWKFCEGKSVLNDIAQSVGYADAPALESAVFALWERWEQEEKNRLPGELIEFRAYLNSL